MLNGTINPNGDNTTYSFEYGTTTSYGNTTSNTQELTGSSDVDVSENIVGLMPNSLYHYRLTATNSGGTTNGGDVTFTTVGESLGADLELQKLIVYSFIWQVGSTITAELMVANIGTATAASQQSQLYLSVDKTINNL